MIKKHLLRLLLLLFLILFSACSGSGDGNSGGPGGLGPSPSDNAPPIVTKINSIDVQENSTQVLTVAANDPENKILTYSLDTSVADSALLNIGGTSGVLTFNNAPDYELPLDANSDNVYETRIYIDDGTNTVSYDLKINIINTGPNATPNTAPTLISGYRFDVDENTTNVGDILATDKEEDGLIFNISKSTDSQKFWVRNITGQLYFEDPPNFEQPTDKNSDNDYEFNVTLSDGELSINFDVMVTVVDANDAPVITSPLTTVVDVNNLFSLQLTAEDEDGTSDFTYSIQPGRGDSRLFNISASGLLKFNNQPTFNYPLHADDYIVGILADDGQSSSKLVDLTVRLVHPIAQLDPTFGNVDPANTSQRLGYVSDFIDTDTGKIEVAHDSAVMSNNSLVVVGQSLNSDTQSTDMTIWQYTEQGVLNTDLSTGFGPIDPLDNSKRQGYITHDNASGKRDVPDRLTRNEVDIAYAVAITKDDKIIVVGTSVGASSIQDSVIWKYTADGQPDTSFGAINVNIPSQRLGFETYSGPASVRARVDYTAMGVALNNDGSIFVTGVQRPFSSKSKMNLWKYTPQGDLDTGFGTLISTVDPQLGRRGYVLLDDTSRVQAAGWGNHKGYAVAVTTEGKVIVVGTSSYVDPSTIFKPTAQLVVWRFTALGELDIGAFGLNDANGTQLGFFHQADVNRLSREKQEFGRAKTVALTADGKILVAAKTGDDSTSDKKPNMVLLRLTANGLLDTDVITGFGAMRYENTESQQRQGFYIPDDSANFYSPTGGVKEFDNTSDMNIMPDGRIVVASSHANSQRVIGSTLNDNIIWRFSADGLLEGFSSHAIDSRNDRSHSIFITNTNKIVTVGASDEKMVVKQFNVVE
ncbi:MAG: hypothetical protein ACC707_02780 [Thiohalomonadales bacterium]